MYSIMYSISILVVQDFDHLCMVEDEGIFSFFNLAWQFLEIEALSKLYICQE